MNAMRVIPRYTARDDAEAAKLVAAGLSFRQAAAELGTTGKTVKQMAARHQKRAKSRYLPTIQEKLLTLKPAQLQRLRKGLDKRELMIFNLRLVAERPETMQQIAIRLEVSRQRIQQIEAKLLERLSDAV